MYSAAQLVVLISIYISIYLSKKRKEKEIAFCKKKNH